MDAYCDVTSSKGTYMVSDKKQTFVFHEVPLPPPLGIFTQNYSRCTKCYGVL